MSVPAPYPVELTGREPFGTRVALVTAEGRLVGPLVSSFRGWEPDGEGGLVAPVADLDGQWGYLNLDGRWVREPVFEEAFAFRDGLARICQDGRWGYVDVSGRTVIEPAFHAAGPFCEGLAAVRVGDGFGYIDRTGQLVIAAGFAAAERFRHGRALVQDAGSGKYGFVDASGRMVIPARFDRAHSFGADGAAPAAANGRWGLIDPAGEWVVAPEYTWIHAFTEDGLAWFERDRYKDGFMRANGERVSDWTVLGRARRMGDRRFDWAEDFDACGAAVVLAEEGWGVLRSDGSFLPVPHREPVTDDEVRGFSFGLAPFLTQDCSTVYVDAAGRDICRVEVAEDGAVLRLLAADGQLAGSWREEPAGGEGPVFAADIPLFTSGPSEHFLMAEAWEGDIVAVARELEQREPRQFLPVNPIYEPRDDPYDVASLSGYEPGAVRTGAIVTLASSYLGEVVWGTFEFLSGYHEDAYTKYFTVLRDRLSMHYGQPLEGLAKLDDDFDEDFDETFAAWSIGDRTLSLDVYDEYGDGDCEYQLRLMVYGP